jgi:8-oxo-dGTP pyrophosphatase MutT (NUDIX family)
VKLLPSAVAIVISRDAAGELVALVGTRHPRSRFLGGYVAFPGGAHEAVDGDLAADADAALRRTASRELHEETGIEVAPGAFLAAGRRATPPFAPRGFDSRMLLAALEGTPAPRPSEPQELLDLGWTRPADLLGRWRALEIRVAPPVLPIVAELARARPRPRSPRGLRA